MERSSTRDVWLAGFEEVLRSGPASGYARTRFLAQMEWALVDMPGIDDIIEFETVVNYVVPKYDDSVICSYDLSTFGAQYGDVRPADASRRHHRRVAPREPFNVDPDQLLRELREQQSHGGSGILS